MARYQYRDPFNGPRNRNWLTQAGRGALLDQIDDAKRGYKGLKKLLTWDGTISEKIEAENKFREWS